MSLLTRSKPASQKDIAKFLGIDQKTVSRVFGAPGQVSLTLRKQVLQAALELGYRPNRGAQAMRTGRFNCVVLLQSTYHMVSHLHAPLLHGIQDGLGEKLLTLARMSDEQLTQVITVPRILRELSSDGVLVNYDTNIPPRMIAGIESQPLPVVWINSNTPAFDSVYPNDKQGGRLVTEYLLNLGHRRIAYLDFQLGPGGLIHYSRVDRLSGYRQAMEAARVPVIEFLPAVSIKDSEMSGYVRNELQTIKAPSALIAYSPEEAAAFMWGAHSLGMKVPEDLSVATFAMEIPLFGIPLTIAQNPMLDVGRIAAEMLLKKMTLPALKMEPVKVDFRMLEGASCRPFKS